MRRAHVGKKQTAKTREKIRLALTGKKQTPETCAKKSKTHLRLWKDDPIYRENHLHAADHRSPPGQSYKRVSPSEETRIKLRVASKKAWENPEYRDKVVKSHTGAKCTPETREKIRRAHLRENNPAWKGGVSSWPYCPKFNNSLKEEVRDAFGRICFLSGAKEDGKRLSVHHCDYLKSQGCQGQRWSLLPLDHGWHSKTNFDRWYWFALLRDYWCYKYLTFHGMDIYEGPDRTAWLWEMYSNNNYLFM